MFEFMYRRLIVRAMKLHLSSLYGRSVYTNKRLYDYLTQR